MGDPLSFAPVAAQMVRQVEPGSYDVTRDGVIRQRHRRTTRNQQCGCGSGRKHKDCCFGQVQRPHPMRVFDDQFSLALLSTPLPQIETKPMKIEVKSVRRVEAASSESETRTIFSTWGIVEVFGHDRYAGFIAEQVIAGQPFVQIAVPEVIDGAGQATPAFIKYLNHKSIFSIVPTTEAEARECQAACGSERLPQGLIYARARRESDNDVPY